MIQARLLQGNEACVRGALAAGVRFFAGYPITPSTDITELFSRELPRLGGRFIQMEDELSSIAAAIGASLTGTKSITATSGPGFSLKQENLGFAAAAEIPLVIINVMRGGPSTGMPTLPSQGDVMQARWGTHGDHPVIVTVPYVASEIYRETARAVNLSERYRVPAIVLLDETVAHVRERVLEEKLTTGAIADRKGPVPGKRYLPYEHTEDMVPPFAAFGSGYRYHMTGLTHDETGFPSVEAGELDRFQRRLNGKLEKHYEDIVRVSEIEVDDAEVVVVSYGSTARSAEDAVLRMRKEGIPVGLFRPITLWPFPERELESALSGARAVIVAEQNFGQMAREVERFVCDRKMVHRLNRVDGRMITPRQIEDMVKEVRNSA